MRILFWTRLFGAHIGGVEIVCKALIHALKDRGHEIMAVAVQGDNDPIGEDICEGIRVHRISSHQALMAQDLKAIAAIRYRVSALKQSFAPDLVHVHCTDPGTYFHLNSRILPFPPTLLTIHDELKDERIQDYALLGQLIRHADAVTTVSEFMLQLLKKNASYAADRMSLVYNGLPESDQRNSHRFSVPRLLCLGRLSREKGFDVALDAFAEIAIKHPDVKLIIAGDGPDREGLMSKGLRLGLSNRVMFPGWIPPEEVSDLIGSATITLMPSRFNEPFGLVALQAAQQGCPVIAARVGGLPEVIEEGISGLLVEPDNSGALADNVLRLLNDPALAIRMGDKGRERANRLFSFETMVDGYERIYSELEQS